MNRLEAYLIFKRLFDVVLSFIGIIILFPLLAILYFCCTVKYKKNGIFKQIRCGRNNSSFNIYKFRSLPANYPENLSKQERNILELKNNKFGVFLRKSSLDELPQLFNVLKGDMSLIGPRPLIFKEEEIIKKRAELKINKLRPGLTGWAQINGRDNISNVTKIQLDNYYFKNMSFRLDMIIFFSSFKYVISKKDIKD